MNFDFKKLFECRATTTLIVVAITLTVLSWNGSDFSKLIADPMTWKTQPWRLLTSTLLHANFLHLAFNIYWTAVFGVVIESLFGSLMTAGLFVFLALASSTPQVAVAGSGIGLSGIGYGLFGFLWALGKWDARHRGILDSRTTTTFVIWFFICIAMSLTGTMPIGNVAHGAGAVAGCALGWTVAMRATSFGARFWPLFLVLVAIGATCTVLRPYLATSQMREMQMELDASKAMEEGRFADAERTYAKVLEADDQNWRAWWLLGSARWSAGNAEGALQAFERADKLHALPKELLEFMTAIRAELHAKSSK